MSRTKQEIVVRALHTTQGEGLDVYAFFIRGSDIVRIADITRVERDVADTLKGFQRPEIRMTLDYEDDLRFFSACAEPFFKKGRYDFTLRDIMQVLNEHPEIIEINQHRQEEFLANQQAKTTLVLKGAQ